MKKDNLSLWNPFIPSERDISRASELAQKNLVLTGVLTFIFFPAGLIYLNRAINPLKILGYTFVLMILASLGSPSGKDKEDFMLFLSFIGVSTMTAEQIITVNSASKKLGENNTSLSSYITDNSQQNYSSYKTNDKAVKMLKELKEKYEANEISEEEFKLQKQQILESI